MENDRKTIFLVDDEVTNLAVGKNALVADYNVFALNSGATLFNMLEKVQPDLILLDVKMPEMTGYDVIKRLKANEKTAVIPVIFLTALNDEEGELEGLSLGAVDYIAKPFSPQLLLKRLEVHLLVEEQRQVLEAQKRELLIFNNNLSRLVDEKTFALEEKTRTVVELKNAILSTMAELVEFRDETTGGHIERVQKYIGVLLDELAGAPEIAGLDRDLIVQSSQLHDVGKIAVKDSVLSKPGKLTPEEFDEMKKHTVFGEKVILGLKDKAMDSDFLEYARIFAVAHHEKWDGSGYPKGLKGEEIPFIGRIMAIADVYDALISPRPYKSQMLHEKAVEIILEGRGSHFDPALADLFAKIHPAFEKIATELADRTE
ncbi:MAG: response regulator [Defluviitaleaceae bacterium]|nr:response regulator [Defluviitaleaceae bacterium]